MSCGLATVIVRQSGKDRVCATDSNMDSAILQRAYTERLGDDLRGEGNHSSVPMLDLSVVLNREVR